jgi:hypothetical protein
MLFAVRVVCSSSNPWPDVWNDADARCSSGRFNPGANRACGDCSGTNRHHTTDHFSNDADYNSGCYRAITSDCSACCYSATSTAVVWMASEDYRFCRSSNQDREASFDR